MLQNLKRSLVATVVVAAGCGGDAIGPDAEPDRPEILALDDFTYRAPTGPDVPAEFGRLWLPSGNGVSNQSLAFVRLLAMTDTPGPPIIYLAGGPGASGIQAGSSGLFGYFRSLLALGDVILLDQRGTGQSSPGVRCNQEFSVPTDRVLDRPTFAAVWRDQAAACADELRARGVDLDEYNTEQSADDIELLRAALGVDQIVVVGYSYGTHLALSYIRRHGSRVARAVLHGVEGPDHTLKLPSNVQRSLEVIDSLSGDPSSLGIRVTGFLDLLGLALQALAAQPESVMVGETLVVIGEFDARLLIANAIGDRDDIEQLPNAVNAVLAGGWGLVAPSILQLKQTQFNLGMTFAMDCASGATPARLARIAAEASTTILGDAINFPFPEICQGWNVPELGDGFRGPVTSDVPVLFVSGSVDGRTPPSNALEVASGFPNGRHLLVERAGHDRLADPAAVTVILRFLRGETNLPERVVLPPLRFRFPS